MTFIVKLVKGGREVRAGQDFVNDETVWSETISLEEEFQMALSSIAFDAHTIATISDGNDNMSVVTSRVGTSATEDSYRKRVQDWVGHR